MLHGSVTLRAAATATAASAAFPPAFRTRTPISVARGWLEATAPLSETTGERREVKGRERTCDSPAILFHCLPSLSRMEIVKHSSYPSHKIKKCSWHFLLACVEYSRPLPSARARIGEGSVFRYFLRGGGGCTQAKSRANLHFRSWKSYENLQLACYCKAFQSHHMTILELLEELVWPLNEVFRWNSWHSSLFSTAFGSGGGFPPNMAYTAMCRWTGYGFWPLCPKLKRV